MGKSGKCAYEHCGSEGILYEFNGEFICPACLDMALTEREEVEPIYKNNN